MPRVNATSKGSLRRALDATGKAGARIRTIKKSSKYKTGIFEVEL